MASATNWLSFSLSPIEMLRSSEHQLLPAASSAASPNHYFADAFYGSDWANQRGHGLYAGEDESHRISDHYGIVDGVDGYGHHQHSAVIPKLEDFLGGGGDPIVYSDSQTETQDDSSLTHLYDHHHHHGVAAYFGDHHHHHHSQELKAIPGFQAFPTNSGSEVDDSVSMTRTQAQIACAEFVGQSPVESPGKEMAVSQYASAAAIAAGGLSLAVNNKGGSNKGKTMVVPDSAAHLDSSKRIADTFGQRTSIYRGVTRHRWTGRYEAHLWDNSCRREGQARKGRQVYLGGYDKEDKAARAYDLAALKYWGPTATTNFPISNYSKELEEMKHVTKQEFIASLRRKSSGFSRGASVYRGVTRHHQQGRWQARIGRVAGNKDLYLGTFATEEEAAEAYDIAAIKFRGVNAVTNFEMSRYDVEAISSSSLPIGSAAKRLKLSLESDHKPQALSHDMQPQCSSSSNSISFSNAMPPVGSIPTGVPFDPSSAAAFYHHQSVFHQIHGNGVNMPSDSTASATSMSASTPMNLLPSSAAAEFFIWPPHSY